jgi:hypothetical protein
MKGERYIDDRNRGLVDLAGRLAYADMPSALSVYRSLLLGDMRMRDVALLGCLDRFFLCVCVLGRRDLIHPWLYDRCREVEAAPDGYLDLWAREHGKSSLITCAGVIQEILIDPELTVAIFSSTQKSARKFLHQIKQEFEVNPFLRWAQFKIRACFSLSIDHELKRLRKLCSNKISAFAGTIVAITFSKVLFPTFKDLILKR